MHCESDFNGGAHCNATEVVATAERGNGERDIALVQPEEEWGSRGWGESDEGRVPGHTAPPLD